MRINVRNQELLRLKLELYCEGPWTLTVEAWRLTSEPWRVCRPVVADSHQFDENPDPDRIKVKSRIRISDSDYSETRGPYPF
jgi:hypothetical protein